MSLPRAACLAAACLVPAALAPAFDLADVQTRGSLRVAVVEGQPGLFAWGPGQAPGFDREVLEGFARLHRVGLSVVPRTTPEAAIAAVAEGRADVTGGVLASEAAASPVDLSVEVLPSRYVVLTRRPQPPAAQASDLAGARVGLVRSAAGAATLHAAAIAPAETLSPADVVEALRSGRVSAVVLRVEQGVLAQRADRDLELGAMLGAPQSVCYAVARTDVALRRSLNEYLGNLRRSATWNRLLITYFKEGASRILKAARPD